MSKMKMSDYENKISENEKGELHHLDELAKEYTDGSKYWHRNGKLHRVCPDGPAVEYPNGHKRWYRNGDLHREYSPAVNLPDGYKEYWLNGKYYQEIKNDKEWVRLLRLIVLE